MDPGPPWTPLPGSGKLSTVDVLVIGGSRFVGYLVVWRLLARGHRVTIFNRGTTPDPFGAAVARVRGDRTTDDLARFLRERSPGFDAIFDFAAYRPSDVAPVLDALGDQRPHYVFISTGQVYLVRTERHRPAREEHYDGPVLAEPPSPAEHDQWSYGVEKRATEDALMDAHARRGLPVTVLRLPMVNGERDYYRRLEGYLWRLLDGGPLILPGGGDHTTRHVYGADAARLAVDVLGQHSTFGRAFNVCQDEQPTLRELLGTVADLLGVRPTLVDVPREVVRAAGLEPVAVSPFSGTWMSCLDPARAKRELGFTHRPLHAYLDNIVQSFLAHPPETRPEGYASRSAELQLADGRGA